jgi:hypothetical protein
MQELNITLNPENYRLVVDFSLYGFKTQNEVINSALNLLNLNLNKSLLESSAKLYLEEYTKDKELENLTESALIY